MTSASPDTLPAGGLEDLSPREFRRISGLVAELTGISLPAAKATLLRSRVSRRLRALGLGSFSAYADLVEADGPAAAEERQHLVSAITTNVTRFFREPHHFDFLAARVLPDLVERARRGGRVRLWSAGCSTGEEPYSMALTLLGAFPEAAEHDVRILATDIDRNVLATAERGLYAAEDAGPVPEALRERYLQPAGQGVLRAGPALRGLVRFRSLNLTLPWPMQGDFDVIFCRNVVIYFDAATELRVWARLGEKLRPGGWLFVGHSERVNTAQVPGFRSEGVATYRRCAP